MRKSIAAMLIVLLLPVLVSCGSGSGKPDSGAGQTVSPDRTDPGATPSATPDAMSPVVSEEDFGSIQNNMYISERGEFRMTVPSGWKLAEQSDETDTVMIVPAGYPEEPDYISVVVSGKDETFEDYSREMFEELYSFLFPNTVILEFSKITVAGLPAVRLVYLVPYEEIYLKQYQYMIDGDYTFSVTFTEVGETDLSDMAARCVENFTVLRTKAEIDAAEAESRSEEN